MLTLSRICSCRNLRLTEGKKLSYSDTGSVTFDVNQWVGRGQLIVFVYSYYPSGRTAAVHDSIRIKYSADLRNTGINYSRTFYSEGEHPAHGHSEGHALILTGTSNKFEVGQYVSTVEVSWEVTQKQTKAEPREIDITFSGDASVVC